MNAFFNSPTCFYKNGIVISVTEFSNELYLKLSRDMSLADVCVRVCMCVCVRVRVYVK